jgi:type II secretory ATPase GspE/PulE/Tfp pilus assembly ATPase PilB-like protein
MNDLLAQSVNTGVGENSLAPGGYFAIWKPILVLVLFVLWCKACEWVDRDTDVVKTKRERWNLIVLAGGLAGLALFLIAPWEGPMFFLGMGFFIVLATGSLMAYVMHRNGRVVPGARLLTPAHIKRVIASGRKDKTDRTDRGMRVRLADQSDKPVSMPQDPVERETHALVQEFLFDVLWRRASDADLLLSGDDVRLLLKIDGVATEQVTELDMQSAEGIIRYLKTIAGLNPEELRRPQSGKIRASLLGNVGEMGHIEVKTSGSTKGERLKLKISGSDSLLRIEEVGIAAKRLEQLKPILLKKNGLVLLSGPRGSGVTTTMYAVLRQHDAFMSNIHALEREPLLKLDNITQTKYEGESTGVSFARQFQSVLRREPDIVGVDNCQDRETAQLACKAAMEERKIYLCIEARDSLHALKKLIDLSEDRIMVARSLLAVVNQRLVRLLCEICRQAYKPDPSLLRKANLPVDKIEHFHRPPTEPVLDKKGREIICQNCQGTGYNGRTAVFEVMFLDKIIAKMIAEGQPWDQIRAQFRKNKMHFLQEEGLFRVIEGDTSLKEILRAIQDEGQ